MTKKRKQFNMPVVDFQEMKSTSLESLCRHTLPDEHFRFVTFAKNDYRQGRLTCQLYNYVPDNVFLSVETALDIEAAIDKLVELNPEVEWSWANLNYFDHDDSGTPRLSLS